MAGDVRIHDLLARVLGSDVNYLMRYDRQGRLLDVVPTAQVELYHYWPDCDVVGCYRCLWWDIAYWVEDCVGVCCDAKGLMP